MQKILLKPHAIWALILVCLVACSDTVGIGTNPDYSFPRTEASQPVLSQIFRARITQQGFDTLSNGVPGLLEEICQDNEPDGSSLCSPEPLDPSMVRLYLSGEEAGVPFNYGEIRPLSFISVDTNSIRDNVKIALVGGQSTRDGLTVSVGCDEKYFSDCNQAEKDVVGSINLELFIKDLPFYEDATCLIENRSFDTAGIIIHSFIFSWYPLIELTEEGRPKFIIRNKDITIHRMEVSLDVQMNKVADDPVCLKNTCILCEHIDYIMDWVVEPLIETGAVASILANAAVEIMLGPFVDRTLDAEGVFDMQQLMSVVNATANPVGYMVEAHQESPVVTGLPEQYGLNFDFNVGFDSEQNRCIESVPMPDWDLPLMPDPGTVVETQDPLKGDTVLEAFDLALIVGDLLLGRTMYSLFQSGNLCLNAPAESIERISKGRFVPQVGLFSLFAPGLQVLAADEAPVEIVVVPQEFPLLYFGNGKGEGESRRSHLNLLWTNLEIALFPLVDDTHIKALSFALSIDLGMSIEPTPTGDIQIMLDRIQLNDVLEIDNEIPLRFDLDKVQALVELILPMLISGDAIDIELTAKQFGFPLVPKLRAIRPIDLENRYLGMFVRFCTAEDIQNIENPLCYEAELEKEIERSNALPMHWEAQLLETSMNNQDYQKYSGHVDIGIHSSMYPAEELEIAYRVDNGGPFYSFRSLSEDGTIRIVHPLLRIPGLHQIELIARSTRHTQNWLPAHTLEIWVDESEIETEADTFTTGAHSDNLPLPTYDTDTVRAETQGCHNTGEKTGWWILLLCLCGYVLCRKQYRAFFKAK